MQTYLWSMPNTYATTKPASNSNSPGAIDPRNDGNRARRNYDEKRKLGNQKCTDFREFRYAPTRNATTKTNRRSNLNFEAAGASAGVKIEREQKQPGKKPEKRRSKLRGFSRILVRPYAKHDHENESKVEFEFWGRGRPRGRENRTEKRATGGYV